MIQAVTFILDVAKVTGRLPYELYDYNSTIIFPKKQELRCFQIQPHRQVQV